MAETTMPSDEALLRELNEGLSSKVNTADDPKELPRDGLRIGDAEMERAPTLAEKLETAEIPRASSSRLAQADKSHSKQAGGNGFRVVVEGEYYAKSTETKGNIVKKYSIPFNLPSLTSSKGEAALGIIVGASRPGGGLLKNALKKMDPLAITFRTHEIVSVTPLGGAPEPTSITYMSFDALKSYVRKNIPDFPVDVDEYTDVRHLREDVIDFKTNEVTEVVFDRGLQGESKMKGGFGVKKTPTDRILARHAERKEEAELAAMNEGVL